MVSTLALPCRMYGLFQTMFFFSYMGVGSAALGILCGESGAIPACVLSFMWFECVQKTYVHVVYVLSW